MATQVELQKRAMHIMIDALQPYKRVLEDTLDDIGSRFSQQPAERKRLIDITYQQACEEVSDPVVYMRRQLMYWTEMYGEPAVSLAWAELIGTGTE